MRKRMLHTSIWTSEQFAGLSLKARLLYIGMITLADDEGRLKAGIGFLRSQIFPYDNIDTKDMEKILKEVIGSGLVVRYQSNGSHFLYHPNWNTYQKLRSDRFRESLLPPPNELSNQMTTKWQPSGRQMPAEVSKKVSKKVSNISKDFSFNKLLEEKRKNLIKSKAMPK